MPPMTITRPERRGCLTLNASYEPLVVLPVQRAVRLVLDGRAELVEAHGTRVIRSAGREMPVPAVIRLVRYVYVPRRMRRGVTNTILFARDGYTCAYCGRHRDALRGREFLTRDHVLPQSRFARRADANTWENCVTACSACNNRKADRTPDQAGMALRIKPVEPQFVHLEWAVRRLTPLQRKYVVQFFGTEVADAL
jgi:5-methylcytosine-specific restriction endonuclease McrA